MIMKRSREQNFSKLLLYREKMYNSVILSLLTLKCAYKQQAESTITCRYPVSMYDTTFGLKDYVVKYFPLAKI